MPNLHAFDRRETISHCRRVCALTRRISDILNLGEDVEAALSIAASLHHVRGARSIIGVLEGFPAVSSGLSNEILALAERILRRVATNTPSGSDAVEISAEVLDLCNEFDEAVEFSVLDGLTFGEAIAEFHQEAPAQRIASPRTALREATTAPLFNVRQSELPVMPKAATKLMRTSNDTSPATLASIVATDPILAARLLEIANSAHFGSRQKITRITDAIARVGVPQARKVLLAACFGSVFASSSLRGLWDKSQRVAAMAAAAAATARLDPDEAFVAGLLHDVGRLLFERGDARSLITVSGWLSSGFPLPYSETLTYSMDHAGAGAELLETWGLPDSIVNAVEYHHRPERSASPMASLLFLAEQWHAEKFAPEGGQDLLQGMRTAYASRLTAISTRDLASVDHDSELLVIAC
jgi:putative nucleotidyltransferase with HDIG domain